MTPAEEYYNKINSIAENYLILGIGITSVIAAVKIFFTFIPALQETSFYSNGYLIILVNSIIVLLALGITTVSFLVLTAHLKLKKERKLQTMNLTTKKKE